MKWAQEARDLYGENLPDYVASKVSPIRDRYLTDSMRDNEMLSPILQVDI